MTSIFSDLLQDFMEVFMDDFTVYDDSFDACLENLSKVLTRCIDTNLVLNFEKCHFIVTEGIVLGHLVSNRGIEVDKSKIDIITSLPNLASVQEVRSFLGHAGFYITFIKNFSKIALLLSKLLQKDVDFEFVQPSVEAFQELKSSLTSSPILQAFNWELLFKLIKIIVFFDHAALRFLLKKTNAKPRLIWWMLLLQEFNIEIKDKKGAENSVADHLSQIERESDPMPVHLGHRDQVGPPSEKCQKARMTQQPILFCEVFDVWEATTTKTNDAKVVVDFLKSNIFYRFDVPKVLISDQEPCQPYSTSRGWCIESPQHTTPKQMAKLKSSIGKSRKN
ncbi:Retrovirus-related Pol polyprotein from transposon 17.6, partial [Mucuna pruriens]